VSAQLLTLVLVVIVALGFDFTNGFHDTGNSMATSIATGALKPKTAVALSAFLNLVGAFLSVEVAVTVTNAVVDIQGSDGQPSPAMTADHGSALLMIILAGLIGGILWNVATWLFGLPSSSSHALFGGLIGATIAGIGWGGVHWTGDSTKLDGVIGKVILPAVASPVIAAVVSMVGTWVIFRITREIGAYLDGGRGVRAGQIGSSSLMSLAHGTNDAQKTMGVITLALIGYGSWTDVNAIPLWVKVSCATAIALGTYVGGWRIIRTMGKGLVEIEPRQGMAGQSAAAAVILASSQLGFALSTTQVATGAIVGSGLGKPGGVVRWSVAGRMVVAWVLTMPMAGAVGAVTWYLGDLVGGGALGALLMVAVLLVLAGWMFLRSRREPINSTNVNDVWNGPPAVVEPSEPVAA
jgi:PiT family inorganic phosphate transporter